MGEFVGYMFGLSVVPGGRVCLIVGTGVGLREGFGVGEVDGNGVGETVQPNCEKPGCSSSIAVIVLNDEPTGKSNTSLRILKKFFFLSKP